MIPSTLGVNKEALNTEILDAATPQLLILSEYPSPASGYDWLWAQWNYQVMMLQIWHMHQTQNAPVFVTRARRRW
jgi:hypothetical protein